METLTFQKCLSLTLRLNPDSKDKGCYRTVQMYSMLCKCCIYLIIY